MQLDNPLIICDSLVKIFKVGDVEVLAVDEPTSELDSEATHASLSGFRHLLEETNLTIFLSSHNPLVDDYMDSIIYLRDGQIDAEG